jgi:hypothetical protein
VNGKQTIFFLKNFQNKFSATVDLFISHLRLAAYVVVKCKLTEISVNFWKSYNKEGDTVQENVLAATEYDTGRKSYYVTKFVKHLTTFSCLVFKQERKLCSCS